MDADKGSRQQGRIKTTGTRKEEGEQERRGVLTVSVASYYEYSLLLCQMYFSMLKDK